jgi:hypothetical protein
VREPRRPCAVAAQAGGVTRGACRAEASPEESLEAFLARCRLPQYLDALVELGAGCVDDLHELEDADYQHLGMRTLERRRFLLALSGAPVAAAPPPAAAARPSPAARPSAMPETSPLRTSVLESKFDELEVGGPHDHGAPPEPVGTDSRAAAGDARRRAEAEAQPEPVGLPPPGRVSGPSATALRARHPGRGGGGGGGRLEVADHPRAQARPPSTAHRRVLLVFAEEARSARAILQFRAILAFFVLNAASRSVADIDTLPAVAAGPPPPDLYAAPARATRTSATGRGRVPRFDTSPASCATVLSDCCVRWRRRR